MSFPHLTFGTWQPLLNVILIVIDIAASRFQYIGIGTFANMVLIGYSADFFRWIWRNVLPENQRTTLHAMHGGAPTEQSET